MIIIEHNLDVIKTADWIIDLGPEGGDGGGTIIATGTPETVAETPSSYTGQYLRKVLSRTEVTPSKPKKILGKRQAQRKTPLEI